MAFGNNGSVSRNTALSVLLGCLMMGVLIGLSPISPLDRASNIAPAGARTSNLRESAPTAHVVATIEEAAETAPEADVTTEVAEDKSGLNWPAGRKMAEDEEGDGFAEGQGAWGPDDEEMEDWVDLWGGVDLVGAVNDADILADDEFSFSYDI